MQPCAGLPADRMRGLYLRGVSGHGGKSALCDGKPLWTGSVSGDMSMEQNQLTRDLYAAGYYFFENHLYLQRCVFANVSLTIAAQKLNTSTRFTYGISLKSPAVPTHDRPACGRGRRVFAAAAPAACGRFERRWQREPGRCPGRYCPCGRAAGWRPVGRKAAPVRRAPLTFIAGLLERRSLQFFSNCQVFLLFYKK